MDMQTTPSESGVVKADKATIDWAGIALFIVLTFGISWIIWLGLAAVGMSFTIRVSIGMFGPAIAATIVRLIRREGFADAGLRLAARGRKGIIRIYIAAYVLPPILIAAGIGLFLLEYNVGHSVTIFMQWPALLLLRCKALDSHFPLNSLPNIQGLAELLSHIIS